MFTLQRGDFRIIEIAKSVLRAIDYGIDRVLAEDAARERAKHVQFGRRSMKGLADF